MRYQVTQDNGTEDAYVVAQFLTYSDAVEYARQMREKYYWLTFKVLEIA